MNKYDHTNIESKWAHDWVKSGLFRAIDGDKKKKSYILIEFPYPSGERLHVGHARSYSCLDAVARKRRMQGENVLFPFGWDAFGLPAENYAIKTGVHPSITTKQNIDNSRKQAISWGLSFDWEREVNTTDPKYYKWTQWIFVQMFKKGLAYKDNIAVNWCPSCKTNLANEEVVDGKCERCGTEAERRMQSQWILAITKYADRLLKDLETVNYREDIKRQQVEWIGRKEGINITFSITEGRFPSKQIVVFTTTPVNFGATFLVIAPEHTLIEEILESRLIEEKIKNEVRKYVEKVKNRSELERVAEGRDKTGVFSGLYVKNHVTGENIPVWVSDFVLASVGTGAIQGCPGHDERDFDFAKKFGLPIKRVVTGPNGETGPVEKAEQIVASGSHGIMVNSEFLNGVEFAQAMKKTMDYFVAKGWGKRVVTYHLRDWVFSRQHYWGEPIPMIYCQKCAKEGKSWYTTQENKGEKMIRDFSSKVTGWYPVTEDQLPVELPQIEKYQPSQTGESPLANVSSWVEVDCPNCGSKAKRETDTMPNWAGSDWYYLRYCDPQNDKTLASKESLKYWTPVDWYNGGMEHTTLHLLYSRFTHKFLYDIGVVPSLEPYAKRTSHGVVLGPDGRRMSKSRGNVINPDEIVAKYGADTLRIYEMFIGPFDQMVVWSDRAMAGVYRFLSRVWDLSLGSAGESKGSRGKDVADESRKMLARLVSKVDRDLEATKFNTAVSACMGFVNWWGVNKDSVSKSETEMFLKVLAPMAPFITEELWRRLGNAGSIHLEAWPEFKEEDLIKDEVDIVVQVNGKTRGIIRIPRKLVSQKEAEDRAKLDPRVSQQLKGKSAKGVVWVEAKLINFVIE